MKQLLKQIVKTTWGLAVFSFGSSFTISASIGLHPWVALSMGFAELFQVTFGTVHAVIGVSVLFLDVVLKEKVGIGTMLDALLVGVMTDFFCLFIPKLNNQIILGLIYMIVGLCISAYGQSIYMAGGLCCGPRDALMVAIGKRFSRIPIGTVNSAILLIVIIASWLLNASLGIGTVVTVFLNGFLMNTIFKLVDFEPRNVLHDGFYDSLKRIGGE